MPDQPVRDNNYIFGLVKKAGGHIHKANDKFPIYFGLGLVIVFLVTASLAPIISRKLGLIFQKKQQQQSFAQNENDTPLPNPVVFDYKSRVDAVLTTDSYVYVGGDFGYVGPDTGPGAPVDVASGQVSSTFPKVGGDYNYQKKVSVAVSDGQGGWYIGGDFTNVESYPISKLAHIRGDGTVDPS